MISLKSKQSGFTIVELLIVIVVIGILAALVITTFTGIQQKARNTERQTDIKAIHGQVEAYYAQNGKYPTTGNLQDGAWITANMKGLDAEALHDPKGAAGNDVSGTAGANVYGYAVTPANCDNGSNGDCTGYTLTATYEGGGTFTKTALN
ncbi:MAG TPA: type II secretion system protein [Candidatus Saccharimonadales bacterium]|nr:type II secretion system protein [Candidatus Saccharimonadales bacterium]